MVKVIRILFENLLKRVSWVLKDITKIERMLKTLIKSLDNKPLNP